MQLDSARRLRHHTATRHPGGRSRDFEDIREAHRVMEANGAHGKMVVVND
jgi:hypothetical protein